MTFRVQSPENERKSASLCLIVLFLLSFTLTLNKNTKSSQYMYKVIVTKMPQTAPQTQMIDVAGDDVSSEGASAVSASKESPPFL